ncbi:MAG: Predicted signal transduction protein [uncultured Caballeronia sp.]|nr:MAG: Predicted signal transduction protein [uncultured Caballeronia sp.]
MQATAHVVARTVGEIRLSAVLGDHRGYVNMNRDLLFDDIVHIMPPERFVQPASSSPSTTSCRSPNPCTKRCLTWIT